MSENEAFRPCESPPEKITKNSITTSDRAVQCEFLTHQPVELNVKSEGSNYKNGGCYCRKSPERSIKSLTPLDDDLLTSYIDVTIDKDNSTESRRQGSTDKDRKNFRKLGPVRTRTETILEIPDQLGPGMGKF